MPGINYQLPNNTHVHAETLFAAFWDFFFFPTVENVLTFLGVCVIERTGQVNQ